MPKFTNRVKRIRKQLEIILKLPAILQRFSSDLTYTLRDSVAKNSGVLDFKNALARGLGNFRGGDRLPHGSAHTDYIFGNFEKSGMSKITAYLRSLKPRARR
jgi:hypothetical protein